MNNWDPTRINVLYLPPATEFRPVDRRKYTWTQSKTTGESYLSIGYHHDFNVIQEEYRDEVLAEWIPQLGQYVLSGKIFISDESFDEKYAQIRFLIFQREARHALSAMIYGDRTFFSNYPWLLDSPIYIHFQSNYKEYNKMIYYETPRQYLNKAMQLIGT
ncbi:staygreen family protein [Cytobacillus massiliigabonensis]|uniref:staygreen family protein n=1 Tax=Cytobacillus massiliigabonensis TaxID=1871011 RepID=UPI000C839760|nr:staygreen family protein [Cytobacillus massiliigabonensis]